MRPAQPGFSARPTTCVVIGRPAGRQLVQHGRFEVAENRHGHGPGDRSGGHDQQVRRLAGLGPQGVALFHAEAVLLVHHDQAQVVEGDVVAQQRVRADHDPGRTGSGVEQGLLARGGRHGAGEQA